MIKFKVLLSYLYINYIFYLIQPQFSPWILLNPSDKYHPDILTNLILVDWLKNFLLSDCSNPIEEIMLERGYISYAQKMQVHSRRVWA